jgi:hypothetical protein
LPVVDLHIEIGFNARLRILQNFHIPTENTGKREEEPLALARRKKLRIHYVTRTIIVFYHPYQQQSHLDAFCQRNAFAAPTKVLAATQNAMNEVAQQTESTQ